MGDFFSTLVRQLENAQPAERPRQRFNPRPAGVIREGSATDAVLKYLRESPGFRTHAQIAWATGRSRSQITWGLIYLRRLKLIDEVADTTRNSKYLRYRVTEKGRNHA